MCTHDIHLSPGPLHLLDNVQAAVDNKLVKMSSLVAEAWLTVTALLGGAKVILEQGVVLSANDGKIVRHCLVMLPIDHLNVVQLELRSHAALRCLASGGGGLGLRLRLNKRWRVDRP